MKKFLIVVSLISLAIFAFFFSNLKGYYRFKQYCEAEGGLRVYEPLERNVGWVAEDKGLAMNAAMLSDVKYSRYKDTKNSTMYDVEYVGGLVANQSSYRFRIASDDKPVYLLSESTVYLDQNNRLKKISYLIDNMVGKKVAEFNKFYYSVWGGNLGGPDWVSCDVAHDWKSSLENAFK